MSKTDGLFKLKKITSFASLRDGECQQLPESDLCFQDDEWIYQFRHSKPEHKKKIKIKPGIFTLTDTNLGITLEETELRENQLLETIDNTSTIIKEAKTFFSKLHIYEQLNRVKKRGVLLFSAPGLGKTSAISKFCRDFVEEDSGTIVVYWPTSEIEADRVSKFLSVRSEYASQCTRLILIIEDIGGGERENGGSINSVDSGLLNLLDGINVTFKLPTFIIATTNHPENLLGALANRPGRFDLMLELRPPSAKERVELVEFIAKRKLTEEESEKISSKEVDSFSIAHLEEVVVRSMLHDKTIPQVVDEMLEHISKFNRNFEDKKSVGIGIGDW
jgi:SpoVK/Ycf46/Vps4 family AAA+-type ATPase